MKIRIEARNAAIGVSNGIIVSADGPFDVELCIPRGELRPGLINAHDHLHRNHYGRLGHPPYANAYEWGVDIHARAADAIALGRAMPRRDALLAGAWKNLRAGVTTVVHHDDWEPAFDADFPIRVVRVANAHSLGFTPQLPASLVAPFAIHLAEGVDRRSADEVRALDALGLLTPDLLAVHVVGADEDGIERLRRSGGAVVWCPTSNRFLFGAAVNPALLAPGVDLLLGSDSTLTGDGDLLDELRYARGTGLVDDARLESGVGTVAARRLSLAARSLAVGERADVAVFMRPLLECSAADVAVVVAGGELRVLDPALVPALGEVARRGTLREAGGVLRWTSDYASGASVGPPVRARQVTRPEMSRRSLT